MPSSHILQFIGGLSFFFYGLYSINQVLQSFAGDRLKSMIARTTESRFRSLITGIVVTFFFQSSSAVTSMTVGLVSSGLISLTQSMAVALGSGIGTTFVVLLMAMKGVVEYGILLVVIGLILQFAFSRRVVEITGEIFFGFGLVFFGLTIMSQATEPLKTYSWIPDVVAFMQNYPFANFMIAAIVTALVHSSGVVLGILVSLAFSDSVTFEVALPFILGANVGTSFTAIMVAMKAKTDGKRTAWANLFLRAGAVAIIYPILPHFVSFQHWLNALVLEQIIRVPVTVHSEIALTHFFFNVYVAAVFLPFLPLGKKLICLLIPTPLHEAEVFGPKYLDQSALSTPSLAFAEVGQEVARMGEIVLEMFRDVLKLFEKYDLDLVDSIQARDHQVDTLYRSIKFYLAKLAGGKLEEEQATKGIHCLTAVNELESIGDTIERHMVRLAQNRWNKGVKFSDEGWKEICEMHHGTLKLMQLTLAALATSSTELALKVKSYEERFSDRHDQLKLSHLMRLSQERRESMDTSAVHLELQVLFHRVNLSLLTMVRPLVN